MRSVLRAGQAAVRTVAGDNSAIERFFRGRYKKMVRRVQKGTDSPLERSLRSTYVSARFRITGDYTSRDWSAFRSGKGDRELGIYMVGSCDLPSVFAAKPLIAQRLNGTCAILRDGDVAYARSDFLLQNVDDVKPGALAEAKRRLNLADHVFEPRLFRPSFRLPDLPGLGDIPKTVTVLSLGADVTRTLYRHKEHGYLIDPGGFWLKQDMKSVTANPQKVEWVRSHFKNIGTLEIQEFRDLFGEVLSRLTGLGTAVVVYNMAVVNPGDLTYNYQFRRSPTAVRRMEFNDALTDLTSAYGASLLNVDRILKREGIRDQVDFAHFPLESMMPIAVEFHRILCDREVL
jgi:hypothetical protein